MSKEMDDLTAAVTAETTVLATLSSNITDETSAVNDAIAAIKSTNDPAQIEAIANQIGASNATIQTAASAIATSTANIRAALPAPAPPTPPPTQ